MASSSSGEEKFCFYDICKNKNWPRNVKFYRRWMTAGRKDWMGVLEAVDTPAEEEAMPMRHFATGNRPHCADKSEVPEPREAAAIHLRTRWSSSCELCRSGMEPSKPQVYAADSTSRGPDPSHGKEAGKGCGEHDDGADGAEVDDDDAAAELAA